MRVLVDTSVWSLALRRGSPQDGAEERELAELVREGRVVMAGPIRQELLSGVRGDAQFRRLREKLRAFDDLTLEHLDYEEAAAAYNRCRARGVQGGAGDFLLCALSLRRDIPIFTQDGDFQHFARVLQIRLHEVRPDFAV
jgi:predicted nucleic acid-binding protein